MSPHLPVLPGQFGLPVKIDQRAVQNFIASCRDRNRVDCPQDGLMGSTVGPCLVANFKIPKLSHRMRILYAWSIKSRLNKKLIA